MISTKLIVIYIFFYTCKSLKVFKFESSYGANYSYATLKATGSEVAQFPESFILCMSHQKAAADGTSYLTIYGEDDGPWFSSSIYISSGSAFIWTRFRRTWKRLREIPRFWLNFWVHICFKANTSTGNFSISINGDPPIHTIANELTEEVPKQLKDKIMIGLNDRGDDDKRQFIGSVTNIILLEDDGSTDISKKSGNLCFQQFSLITSTSTWELHGNMVEEEEEGWKVCNKNETYRVAIGAPMGWNQGLDLCKNLGSSIMTELKNPVDMNFTLGLFEKIDTTCKYIWTPLTDEEEEGRYVNTITGKPSTFLPWKPSEPNGFKDENIVLLSRRGSPGYTDNVVTKKPSCTVCDINRKTTFNLLGGCKETYFGKPYCYIEF